MMKRAAPLLLLLICLLNQRHPRADGAAFVRVSGLHFTVNGSPFFANGFNAYWLMSVAADAASRSKVSTAFQEAASHGLTVCRTWAFSDGGFRALQISPGVYDEQVFRVHPSAIVFFFLFRLCESTFHASLPIRS